MQIADHSESKSLDC